MKLIRHKITRQELFIIAVFGAVWGFIEITAGTGMQIAKVPLRGFIMTFLAGIILTSAKGFARFRGSLIYIAAITATFKFTAMGGFVLTPLIAIISEAVIAEIIFSLPGYRMLTAALAGTGIIFYTFVHAFLAHIFFYGFDILKIYDKLLKKVTVFTGIELDNYYALITVTAALIVLLGSTSGILGFRIARRTKDKLSLYNQPNLISKTNNIREKNEEIDIDVISERQHING